MVGEATPPVVSEREEEKEEEVKEEEKTTTKTLSVESIQNMTEDELRVLELSVKMRDVLSKEKSNALREARLSVERKQLEAKLAGLDLKKESNETMKTTNDMKRESLEFKMKLNREKVFREDVADALRTGLVVVCGALVYFGWNVIRDAWLNESEICYSSSSFPPKRAARESWRKNTPRLSTAWKNCGASPKRSPKPPSPRSRVYTVPK